MSEKQLERVNDAGAAAVILGAAGVSVLEPDWIGWVVFCLGAAAIVSSGFTWRWRRIGDEEN